jgi:hypothetical protein
MLQVGGISTSSVIPAPAVRRASTIRPAVLSSTSLIPAFKIARPALIQAATLRSVSTIPVCSGIGIRPARPGPSIPGPVVHGASVSFKDFTLGWTELHRFLKANEWATDLPSMTVDNSGTAIHAWTGGQQNGMCISRRWHGRSCCGVGNY